MSKKIWLIGCALAAMAATTPAQAQEPPRPIDTSVFGAPGAACAELRYTNFARVPDAMTQITKAEPVASPSGDYCEVEGYVWRQTRFRLRFPLKDWNQKLVVQGGGGQSGDLPNDPGAKRDRSAPLRKGFAVANHNGGHFSTITDGKWAYFNDGLVIDFAFRSPQAVTLASKAILESFYGRRPRRAYYDGCSNGGREAMMMAQRFPKEFDGIIAGAPSIDVRSLFVNLSFAANLLRDQSRNGFDKYAAQTLHGAAIAQCDKLDGKLDKLIGDPRICKVDLKPIMCTGDATTSCLTPHQADIARQMYEGPRNSRGEPFVAFSAYPGSELSWVSFTTPRWTIDYANDVLRYSAFYPAMGPEWEPDPSKLEEYADRMGVTEGLSSALNPDLRRFKANGGKLLSYYGWTDFIGGADSIMDYYSAAERVIGSERDTQDFFRLFMMPGMDHCGGGEGAFVYDYLGTLDNWVETGKAPASMTGFRPGPDGKPAFNYTVFPFRVPRK